MTNEEYENIIKRLIVSNWTMSFKAVEINGNMETEATVTIRIGIYIYVWRGLGNDVLTAPLDYLFEQIMNQQRNELVGEKLLEEEKEK